ncbi:hypothetical protein MANES_12G096900v8 [Manihot esculenta]|uniref:Uncharacterized protein n=1 Tax=Manihot esculenta TaxID=3983 RepID=A0A2C9UX20_MANES|nr:hypothetical protein MANES_12G096900v8 [Manihot esculenta]
MGLCASSQSLNTAPLSTKLIASPLTIKVIHSEGKLQELKHPTRASFIKIQNPNCFLCSLESMSVGMCVPQVSDDEELQLGQIYFLLPLSQAHKPLFLSDLCALAAKASSALGNATVDLCSSGASRGFFR